MTLIINKKYSSKFLLSKKMVKLYSSQTKYKNQSIYNSNITPKIDSFLAFQTILIPKKTLIIINKYLCKFLLPEKQVKPYSSETKGEMTNKI